MKAHATAYIPQTLPAHDEIVLAKLAPGTRAR
jgi:hypothetical protein